MIYSSRFPAKSVSNFQIYYRRLVRGESRLFRSAPPVNLDRRFSTLAARETNLAFIKNIPGVILAKESFVGPTCDAVLRSAIKTKNTSDFWLEVKNEHSALSAQALWFPIPFVSTYLCENTFFYLLCTENKRRNKLNVENDLTPKVTNMKPDINACVTAQRIIRYLQHTLPTVLSKCHLQRCDGPNASSSLAENYSISA